MSKSGEGIDNCQNQQCPAHIQSFCTYRFDRIDESLRKIDERLGKIETYIFVGNGKPALTHRVEKIEESHDTHKKVFLWFGGAIVLIILGIVVPKLLPFIGKFFHFIFAA